MQKVNWPQFCLLRRLVSIETPHGRVRCHSNCEHTCRQPVFPSQCCHQDSLSPDGSTAEAESETVTSLLTYRSSLSIGRDRNPRTLSVRPRPESGGRKTKNAMGGLHQEIRDEWEENGDQQQQIGVGNKEKQQPWPTPPPPPPDDRDAKRRTTRQCEVEIQFENCATFCSFTVP